MRSIGANRASSCSKNISYSVEAATVMEVVEIVEVAIVAVGMVAAALVAVLKQGRQQLQPK